MPRVIARAAAAATLAAAVALAGCGSKSDDSASSGGSMAGMDMGSSSSSTGSSSMGDMSVIASATKGGVKVGVETMAPETFYVSDGSGEVKHAPKANDSVHLMVTLADAESGIRLPDASVTVAITGPDGRSSFDGPLYPMIGRGMGLHYGENVAFKAPGTYSLQLVTGPPRVGRHTDVATAWNQTIRLPLKIKWDGKTATAAS